MYSDEVIEEVWRNREAYAAEHDHDLDKIVCDLLRRQEADHAMVVDRRKQDDGVPRRPRRKQF